MNRGSGWLLMGLLTLCLFAPATAQQLDTPRRTTDGEVILSEPLPIPVGIKLDSGQQGAESAQRSVVLIPGLLAGAESLQAVRRELQSRDVITETFHYTSAQGIVAAADLLSRELQRIHQSEPSKEIILVTHSMGGVVARAVVEDSNRFSNNVTKLLMIAPPNHGSALAELSTQKIQQTLLAKQSIPEETVRAVDQLIEQFFGLAKADLCPNSPFLKSLNQLSRNPKVEYAIYCGTGGPLPGEALALSFLVGGFLFQDEPDHQKSLEQIRKLAMLPEWIRGSGDGIVSVASARLEGVERFETFDFAHNDFGATPSSESSACVKQLVQILN